MDLRSYRTTCVESTKRTRSLVDGEEEVCHECEYHERRTKVRKLLCGLRGLNLSDQCEEDGQKNHATQISGPRSRRNKRAVTLDEVNENECWCDLNENHVRVQNICCSMDKLNFSDIDEGVASDVVLDKRDVPDAIQLGETNFTNCETPKNSMRRGDNSNSPRTPLSDITNIISGRSSNQCRRLTDGKHSLRNVCSPLGQSPYVAESNSQICRGMSPNSQILSISDPITLGSETTLPLTRSAFANINSALSRGDKINRNRLPYDSRIVRDLSSTFEKGSSSREEVVLNPCSIAQNTQCIGNNVNINSLTFDDYSDESEDDDDPAEYSEESDTEFVETEISNNVEGYFDVGDPDQVCEFCGARFWLLERIRPKRKRDRPINSKCCSKGKVKVPFLARPPEYLFKLMTDKDDAEARHFQDNIRAYNTMFSFTSMGGKIDRSINNGGGRFVYRLSGQNHHRIGSLLPAEGQNPRFAQLYIYDTQNEVNNRLQSLSGRSDGNSLDMEVVKKLQIMIYEHNRVARVFKMTRDRLEGQEVPNMKLRLLRKRGKDARLYSSPICDEIAALVVGDVDVDNGDRDIIVETQSGFLQRIHELHPLYVPLHYPMFLPYGEDGFCESTLHAEHTDPDNRKNGKMTLRVYFGFRIQFRDRENTIILYGRRLFQQFVVDAYTMIESWRLTYIRFNQKKLRQDLYKGLSDAVFQGEREGAAVGKRIVLPSSFTGGPRYLMQNYQDAMAICKWAGYPDIFLTFTCNPKWPEFQRFTSARALKIEDRPDVAVRIFKMKLNELMDDLRGGTIFGPLKAAIYTIEFQKRGLPHAHIILFLQPHCKHMHPEDIDNIISAEMPNEEEDPKMHALVKEFMVHGPCGAANPNSPCMIDGRCSKYYPKDFEPVTKVNEDGFPIYRRRDDGTTFEKGGVMLDNRSVVAHNRKLIRKHRSHINTEYCNQGRSVKYLFKYISKGNDRVTVALYQQSNSSLSIDVDEIKCYYDCRYISLCEAMWRIYAYEINYRKPAVERLKLHLPGE